MRNILEKTKNIQNTRKSWITKAPGTQNLAISQKIQRLLNKAYASYTKQFNKQISPIIELPEDDKLCAKIANESYLSPELRSTQINTFTLETKLSTSNAAVYIDKTRHICIIGFRGTVIKDLKDISSDAQIVLDIQGIDPRVKECLHAYDTCKRKFETYEFRVCGHSLGGTLSYIVAKHRESQRCIVFNPGVSLNTFFLQMIEDTIKKSIRTENTKTYKILGDIVSTAAFVGHTKIFSIKSRDPLKLHAMDNFIQNNEVDNSNTKNNL